MIKGSYTALPDAALALEQGKINADFDFSVSPCYVGQEVVAKSTDAPGAVRWQWTTSGAQTANFNLPEAKLVLCISMLPMFMYSHQPDICFLVHGITML